MLIYMKTNKMLTIKGFLFIDNLNKLNFFKKKLNKFTLPNQILTQ